MRKLLYLLAGMLLLFSSTLFAQQREVTGKVTDANGVPVNGASIRVKNARTGTSAAADGSFKINVAPNSTLIISGVGFETREIAVGNEQNFDVSLQLSSSQSLNEVVITALGIKREKKALGYSVSVVTKKDLELRPEGDIARVLTGKAAGVNIVNTSGISGSGTYDENTKIIDFDVKFNEAAIGGTFQTFKYKISPTALTLF